MIYDTWKAFELDSATGRNFKESVYIFWRPPPTMWVKLNSDGAVSLDENIGGAEVAIPNDRGNLLWGAALPLSFVSSFETDAIALRLGLLMVKVMEATKAVVELGSHGLLNVVQHKVFYGTWVMFYKIFTSFFKI